MDLKDRIRTSRKLINLDRIDFNFASAIELPSFYYDNGDRLVVEKGWVNGIKIEICANGFNE